MNSYIVIITNNGCYNNIIVIRLVVSTSLKNIYQLGSLFPIYGKIKFMLQTTNQYCYYSYENLSHHEISPVPSSS